MEPLVGVNFAHFVPYGSGQLDGESRLSGAFGSASLDGMSDYYSQLIYKVRQRSNDQNQCHSNVLLELTEPGLLCISVLSSNSRTT